MKEFYSTSTIIIWTDFKQKKEKALESIIRNLVNLGPPVEVVRLHRLTHSMTCCLFSLVSGTAHSTQNTDKN